MKRLLLVGMLVLAGCDVPPPPKDPPPPAPIRTHSTLSITIGEDGSSTFSFTMYSNARSSAEGVQKAIKHLQDTLEGKAEAEDKTVQIQTK